VQPLSIDLTLFDSNREAGNVAQKQGMPCNCHSCVYDFLYGLSVHDAGACDTYGARVKIKVLGTRGEIESSAPWHSRHSGVLVNDAVLFDLGEAEFLDCDPQCIFITHLHPDHAYFVRSGAETPEINVPVYAPEPSPHLPGITVIEGTVECAGLAVTPVPTHHSKHVESRAYVIEEKPQGARLLYTGDLIWINKEHWGTIGRVDMVVTEGSFLRKGGMVRRDRETGELFGHKGVGDLVRLLGKFTPRIVVMHFGSWFYRDIAAARRKLRSLGNEVTTVEAARDGQEFEI